MSKTVSFINKGVIDIRAVTIFGVSSKEKENPIGFFGTGLKYAIAICLRLGCSVTLYQGLKKFEFRTVRETIRVDEFGVIYMNDTALGFTTDLGKTWEMWQAFRELYCNTMDENGSVEGELLEPKENHTLIVVHGFPMVEAYHNRHETILESKPLHTIDGVEVHPQSSKHVFYRGIRVGKLEHQSQRTYNITAKLGLTEDRTLEHSWAANNRIRDAVLNSPSENFVEEIVFAREGSFEANLSLANSMSPPNLQFMNVMENADFKRITNKSSFDIYKTYNRKEEHKDPKPTELQPHHQRQLNRSIAFCERLGYKFEGFKIIPTEDLSHNVLAYCRLNETKLFINMRAFTLGQRMVAGCLIEEHIHMNKSLLDESRSMQNHLLDLVVEYGERLLGETL